MNAVLIVLFMGEFFLFHHIFLGQAIPELHVHLYVLRHTATIRIDGKISIQAVTYTISRATRHMRQIANTAVFRSGVPLHIHAMWHVKAYLQRMKRKLWLCTYTIL